jgi:hypothetical protein
MVVNGLSEKVGSRYGNAASDFVEGGTHRQLLLTIFRDLVKKRNEIVYDSTFRLVETFQNIPDFTDMTIHDPKANTGFPECSSSEEENLVSSWTLWRFARDQSD